MEFWREDRQPTLDLSLLEVLDLRILELLDLLILGSDAAHHRSGFVDRRQFSATAPRDPSWLETSPEHSGAYRTDLPHRW